ncbi:hypothetical protein LOAG_04963 [Loa loa]|uniref:Uncharacterized protein n=1 Tax=Loa loa TaxID=7209 RepID=A0A1S0U0X1_LOALO|nr:hypothetical protein LOAG_04963 [Loa loa]EFO23527.1 hypothetical protein LOAG_04963 [Loa loa]
MKNRFMKYEETVRQFQVESSNKSLQLMQSIRTQMITLKYKSFDTESSAWINALSRLNFISYELFHGYRKTLALRESAKKMLPLEGILQKKTEADEIHRS